MQAYNIIPLSGCSQVLLECVLLLLCALKGIRELMSLSHAGTQIEEPFATLPLGAYCEMMSRHAKEQYDRRKGTIVPHLNVCTPHQTICAQKHIHKCTQKVVGADSLEVALQYTGGPSPDQAMTDSEICRAACNSAEGAKGFEGI